MGPYNKCNLICHLSRVHWINAIEGLAYSAEIILYNILITLIKLVQNVIVRQNMLRRYDLIYELGYGAPIIMTPASGSGSHIVFV